MSVAEVPFQHYRALNTLGIQGTAPRLSWKIKEQHSTFSQRGDEVKLTIYDSRLRVLNSSLATRHLTFSQSVQWPFDDSLQSRRRVSVRRMEVIIPKDRIVTPSGRIILDFGQNPVGYLRLKDIRGPRGHEITLRHAEVLENGKLGTRRLRFCEALDQYTLKGSEDEQPEMYEPRFTFHGFRYAQIDGWVGDLDLATASNAIQAVVCHTDMRSIGGFSCSNSLLNQLYRNVVWGMKGNFLSVPTDYPQRDERLG